MGVLTGLPSPSSGDRLLSEGVAVIELPDGATGPISGGPIGEMRYVG